MKSGEINSLFKNLSRVIKNPKSDLKYKNKFTLLVSVVLSAQCTDVNVNNVTKKIYLFPSKKELNILKINSIKKYLKKKKPKYLIHLAGLSRPMSVHDTNIEKSINLNIIGTSNIVSVCSLLKIKVIYFSTNYVYPNAPGRYKEENPVYPVNTYAWSKLGGECAVQMYKNSLIIRACMTEYPFVHKFAYSNMFTNFIKKD